jgi:hypothetical protein
MKKSKKFPELILVLVLIILPLSAYSQADSSEYKDSSSGQKKISGASKNTLYLGAGAGSNLIYLGSIISKKQPFTYSSLIYGFNNELYISLSGIHLPGINPYLPFYSGSLSYSHVFNSWFDINTGLSANKFSSSLTDSLLTSFIYGDVTLGIDLRLIYTKITAGGMLADEMTTYFLLRNSRYFRTPGFGRHKTFFSFDPYINIIAGTYLKSEYNTTITGAGMESGAKKSQSSTSVSWSSHFGIMEYDFGLPVAINLKRFSIEAEGGYVIPAYSDPELPQPKGFVFMISGSIKIF